MNDRQVYLIGGGCGLIIGTGYLAIIALYGSIGAPPLGVEPLLLYLATNSSRWWWIIGVSVATDFLFIPFAASIYFVLRNVNRYVMFLAAAFIVLFVILDLAVTWTHYATLMALGSRYLRTLTEVQKSSIITTAEPVSAILHSKLLFVYNSFTLAAGILFAGIVMLRASFGKASAYLGIATGCAGVLAVVGSFFTTALNSAIILASCLTALWVFVVGYQFCRRASTVPTP